MSKEIPTLQLAQTRALYRLDAQALSLSRV